MHLETRQNMEPPLLYVWKLIPKELTEKGWNILNKKKKKNLHLCDTFE